jgi:hypothetical protein
MPPRKEKNKNELGEILCNENTCKKVLNQANCEKNRFTCKECRKEQAKITNIKNSEKINTITHQVCTGICGLNLPIISFEKTPSGFRKECKKCRWESRSNKPKLSREIIKEKVKDQNKKCIECKIDRLIIENFTIHTNNFRNVCNIILYIG